MAIDIKKLNQTQLNELIKRAESRKHELNNERIAKVRAKVLAFAQAERFTIEELFGGHGRIRTRRKAAAKFRNPADHSQTWSRSWQTSALVQRRARRRQEGKDLLV